MIAQILGATVAGGVLFVIASGAPGFDAVCSGFATNGYGELSPATTRCWPCSSPRSC